jgi:peroxiredoxin
MYTQSYSHRTIKDGDNPKTRVYVFLGTECPFSQNYTKSLNSLNEKYQVSNVDFIAVFSNSDDSKRKIKQFSKVYKIQFEVVSDKKHKLLDRFSATITPEVVVINDKGERVYSGKIDNWAEDLGVRRAVVTEFYLEDALSSIVNNTVLKIKTTKAVGCFIHNPDAHKNHQMK